MTTTNANPNEVFSELRAILEPYASRLVVTADNPNGYSLDTQYIMPNKQPLFFGAVKVQKNYVSFYLMPVYACPELLEGISDSLRKRMQGKSCFNFKHIDRELFRELTDLTRAGFERYRT
ncbi:hypothetical protein EG832_19490, partial [bacterium]|nr:hypothetical protein [bacterium]